MKKLFLLFSFLFLLILSSCDNKVDESERKSIMEAINNYDIKDNNSYFYINSNEKNNFSVNLFENEYTFSISDNVYKYNLSSNDIYKNDELFLNMKFEYPDQLAKYIYDLEYDGILISFDEFIPFIKDILKNSEEIKIGRNAPESRISDSYYYSVLIKEELIIESSIYSKLKIALHNFNENKDEDIKVSIIASIENKKIDTVIEFSINDNCIFYL